MGLKIVYWNTVDSLSNMEQALEDSREFDVVAFQEPYRNQTTISIYYNERYYRIFDEGKITLFIYKKHPITSWSQ
jgi:hypothetical protein